VLNPAEIAFCREQSSALYACIRSLLHPRT